MAKMAIIIGVLLAYLNRVDRKIHFIPENTREQSLFYGPLTTIAVRIFPHLETGSESSGQKHQV
jgi:hypothetical protein